MSLLSREEARRIVDFAAGLCFALRGKMQKIDSVTFADPFHNLFAGGTPCYLLYRYVHIKEAAEFNDAQ